MNLDQGLEPKSVTLDITPLIDIVFLLVLFFAVTTSFISPEDLAALKQGVETLTTEKGDLTSQIQQQQATIQQTQTQLAQTEQSLTQTREQLDLTSTERDTAIRDAADKLALLNKTTTALEQARNENRDAERQIEQLQQTAETLRTSETQLQSQLQTALDSSAQLQQQLDASATTQVNLRDQLSVANQQSTELKQQLTESQTTQNNLQNQLSAAEQQQNELQQQLASSRATGNSYQEQLKAVRELERKLSAQVALLAEKNKELEQNSSELSDQLTNVKAESERYKAFYDANQERVERVTQAEQTLTNNFNAMDLNSVLNIEREPNQLTIQLSNQILFDSGSATLKPEGLDVLRRVGAALKDKLGDMTLQVGGHTDNVPISGGRFANNWDLSAARAVNVVDFLERDVGIDPSLLSSVGYGENRPIAPNDTPEQRALNRRIELVLLPR